MISTKITLIDYEQLVQDALKGVIRQILADSAKNGLPGSHHYYISFSTAHPGVDMPEYLKEEYPEEITIVLQFEFWDLEAEDDAFAVTLCFNEMHERLRIPFDAIISFVDPSVKFGLQFTPTIHEKPKKPKKKAEPGSSRGKGKKVVAEATGDMTTTGAAESNVIALDAFRKKP